jgi:hypothetical protein
MTTKKVERFLNQSENKEFAANYCADKFPVKETIRIDTLIDTLTLNQYIQTIQEIQVHDTIQGKERIIEVVKTKFKDMIIQSPPKTIVKEIVKENTARIVALTEENKRINSQLLTLTIQNGKLQRFRLLTFVFLFLFLLFVALYFYMKKNKLIP